jgi:electron transfer flavoprotein alpha subunit
MMADTLLYLAHTDDDGSLGKAALETLTAAVETSGAIGSTLLVGLIGGDVQSAADSISGCGAGKICGVSGGDYAVSRYATDAAAAAALISASDANIVIAPQTQRFARALPGAASRIDGRTDTHITGISTEGGVKAQRWYYRQRMAGMISREQGPWVLLLETGVYAAWSGDSGSANVEAVTVDAPATRTKVIGTEAPIVSAQTIKPDAEVLFVAGAGWTKKQSDGELHPDMAEKNILGFIRAADASLGSSKSLTDQASEGQEILSFLTHMNQIGQTGATPRHQKGLATCCHGEEPHVVGWRFINERRAINLDGNCGWAQGKADVLYVADAFAVIEKVNALLS